MKRQKGVRMTLIELMRIADELYRCAYGKIEFDSDGWPVFQKEHFLDEWPGDMVTYENRTSNLILPEAETVICFYMGDVQNFRRFKNLLNDIPVYQRYLGVVVPDITITRDMDCEMQEMMMLTNQLFAAALVANNIKIVFNTRSGIQSTTRHFKNVPRHVICASGFLGCENATDSITATPYINKILGLMPEKLMIYGKHDIAVDKQLDLLGIDYRYYSDFHSRSKHATRSSVKGRVA